MESLSPPMTLIIGPCVIEDEGLVMEIAQELRSQLNDLDVELYFKASFDKANRSSIDSFRGPGLKEGLRILEKVKGELALKLLTDVHTLEQVEPVSQVVDYIQVPAFLCRQTDLVVESAKMACLNQCRLNIKKGQFLAPWDVKNIKEKVDACLEQHMKEVPHERRKKDWFTITERGSSFGYNNLVVDMSGIHVMRGLGLTVVYDATHSIQLPGGGPGAKRTDGKRQYLETLARSAFAAGADGLFMECHPRPSEAKSDAANAFPLQYVRPFVEQVLKIRSLVSEMPYLLPESQEVLASSN